VSFNVTVFILFRYIILPLFISKLEDIDSYSEPKEEQNPLNSERIYDFSYGEVSTIYNSLFESNEKSENVPFSGLI